MGFWWASTVNWMVNIGDSLKYSTSVTQYRLDTLIWPRSSLLFPIPVMAVVCGVIWTVGISDLAILLQSIEEKRGVGEVGVTGKAALEELVPKAMTNALENVLRNFRGEVLVTSHNNAGKTMAAKSVNPNRTVRTQRPSPTRVWYRSQAFTMDMDMSDAIPKGEIQSTQHTILLMQLLNTYMRFDLREKSM